MRTINITFEDKDMILIEPVKKSLGKNWREYILHLTEFYRMKKEDEDDG